MVKPMVFALGAWLIFQFAFVWVFRRSLLQAGKCVGGKPSKGNVGACFEWVFKIPHGLTSFCSGCLSGCGFEGLRCGGSSLRTSPQSRNSPGNSGSGWVCLRFMIAPNSGFPLRFWRGCRGRRDGSPGASPAIRLRCSCSSKPGASAPCLWLRNCAGHWRGLAARSSQALRKWFQWLCVSWSLCRCCLWRDCRPDCASRWHDGKRGPDRVKRSPDRAGCSPSASPQRPPASSAGHP